MVLNIDTIWQILYKKTESISLTDDDRSELLDALASIVQSIVAPANRDHVYALAYALYHFRADASDLLCRILLEHTLQSNPKDYDARLLLGHFYYDSKQWSEAQKHLEMLEPAIAAEHGQVWKTLKVSELIASCKIRQGEYLEGLTLADSVCDQAVLANAEDLPLPVELVDTLFESRNELKRSVPEATYFNVACKLESLLERSNAVDLFSEKLTRIKS